MNVRIPCALIALAALPHSLQAGVIVMSTGGPATIGGTDVTKGDVYTYNTTARSVTTPFLFDGDRFKNGLRDVDAAHVLSDGSLVFSTDGGATLSGELGENSFDNGTLIRWDGSQDAGSRATIFLDRTAFTFGANENVDAVHVRTDGSLVFSTVTSGRLTFGNADPGDDLRFDPDDLIHFDPVSLTASILMEGSSFFSGAANVDAVHELGDGQFVFSTLADATMDSTANSELTSYARNDLIRFDPVNQRFSLHLHGNTHFGDANLNALGFDAVPEPSTFAVLGLCATLAGVRRYRRQRARTRQQALAA